MGGAVVGRLPAPRARPVQLPRVPDDVPRADVRLCGDAQDDPPQVQVGARGVRAHDAARLVEMVSWVCVCWGGWDVFCRVVSPLPCLALPCAWLCPWSRPGRAHAPRSSLLPSSCHSPEPETREPETRARGARNILAVALWSLVGLQGVAPLSSGVCHGS